MFNHLLAEHVSRRHVFQECQCPHLSGTDTPTSELVAQPVATKKCLDSPPPWEGTRVEDSVTYHYSIMNYTYIPISTKSQRPAFQAITQDATMFHEPVVIAFHCHGV